MSNIQRWNHYWYGPDKVEDGSWVTYGEHISSFNEAASKAYMYITINKDDPKLAENVSQIILESCR